MAASPDVIAAKLQEALALHQQGQLARAEALYREVLQAQPGHADALHFLGVLALQQHQAQVALELIGKALSVDPVNSAAYSNRALALHALERYEEALASCDLALVLRPDSAEALNNRGNALQCLRRHEEALASYDRALAFRPEFAEALNNRGNALRCLGRLEEALASCERALALQPDYAEALNNRGSALQELGRHDEALANYDRWLALRPDDVEALGHRGLVLVSLGRHVDGLASYDRALTLKPRRADLLYSRGVALQELRRHAEAVSSYDRALALQPDLVDALYNRGLASQELKRPGEALASYDRALVIRPDHVEALNDRGNALRELRRCEEAVASYDRALALRPAYAEALNNRANALQDLARLEEALAGYAHALAVRPDLPFVFGAWLYSKMKLCDWSGLDETFVRLGADIDAGRPVASPFDAMATPLSRAQQRRCAEIYVQHKYPGVAAGPLPARRGPGERIRLGYFSADFRNHPVAVLTAGLFEHQDRQRFELIAFAFGPPTRDALRARIAAACDQFLDVGLRTDAEVAAQARALGIDIAVDLMGFTRDSRTGLFARRVAPVQVNYLGFPGTLGAGYMDYLIADATVIPPEHAADYAEQIAWLPHSFQPNDARRPIAAVSPDRRALGLPPGGFVFCNFNNAYKLTPDDFDGWMRLLHQVAGSVLWLAGTHPAAERNLRAAAAARGVAAERLVFKARTAELADHLAELRHADLFLDCRYFNAHTTASDALWAGVPLLTRLGETYASRVAASLLTALGLPELITTSAAGYEALALDLATDPDRLAALRERLAARRLTHPLFDTAGFTRHLEAAYTTMWQRHLAGLAPEHILVGPESCSARAGQ